MAGSTESNKRMGEMVSKVSAHGCPKGYAGTPPDCKKIRTDIDGNTLDDIDFDKIFKDKDKKEKPTILPYDPIKNKIHPTKGFPYEPGDNNIRLELY